MVKPYKIYKIYKNNYEENFIKETSYELGKIFGVQRIYTALSNIKFTPSQHNLMPLVSVEAASTKLISGDDREYPREFVYTLLDMIMCDVSSQNTLKINKKDILVAVENIVDNFSNNTANNEYWMLTSFNNYQSYVVGSEIIQFAGNYKNKFNIYYVNDELIGGKHKNKVLIGYKKSNSDCSLIYSPFKCHKNDEIMIHKYGIASNTDYSNNKILNTAILEI